MAPGFDMHWSWGSHYRAKQACNIPRLRRDHGFRCCNIDLEYAECMDFERRSCFALRAHWGGETKGWTEMESIWSSLFSTKTGWDSDGFMTLAFLGCACGPFSIKHLMVSTFLHQFAEAGVQFPVGVLWGHSSIQWVINSFLPWGLATGWPQSAWAFT